MDKLNELREQAEQAKATYKASLNKESVSVVRDLRMKWSAVESEYCKLATRMVEAGELSFAEALGECTFTER